MFGDKALLTIGVPVHPKVVVWDWIQCSVHASRALPHQNQDFPSLEGYPAHEKYNRSIQKYVDRSAHILYIWPYRILRETHCLVCSKALQLCILMVWRYLPQLSRHIIIEVLMGKKRWSVFAFSISCDVKSRTSERNARLHCYYAAYPLLFCLYRRITGFIWKYNKLTIKWVLPSVWRRGVLVCMCGLLLKQ